MFVPGLLLRAQIMDAHFLTKRLLCVDLPCNPGQFVPYRPVNLIIDHKRRYHRGTVLVTTFNNPPKIIR